MKQLPNTSTIIVRTRHWVKQVVVELNLCPFARKPYEGEQVRYVVSKAAQPVVLLEDLNAELEYLRETDEKDVETTILILPCVLQDFLDYNDFLGMVDDLLDEGGYTGEFQVASFHPDYQFAGTHADDAENYTNRSPYPMLHLLRSSGMSRAIDSYARPDKIPERNIRTMEKLGAERMRELLKECMQIEVDES